MPDLLDTQPTVNILPAKLKWLKGIVHKLGVKKIIDPNKTIAFMLFIDCLQEKIEATLVIPQAAKQVTKKDLIKCNDILKYLRNKHKFKIGWRGDLIWDLLPKEWDDN